MAYSAIEIAKNVITAEEYEPTAAEIDSLLSEYQGLSSYELFCAAFNYGFEMGARAAVKGKYKPYQIKKMMQIRNQRGRKEASK